MAETDQTSDVAALTVQLLSAYLANNTVPAEALAELIRTTKAALTQEHSSSAEESDAEVFAPAVTARKSLASPEHIISLIDGKPYKTLKRHLATRGLTPDEYRARYNLPASYPMVAPAYAEQRRAVAHRLGLGRKGPKAEAAEEQENVSPPEAGDTQLSPEAASSTAATAKPVRKTSAKRASQNRPEAKAAEQDGSADVAASPTLNGDTDDSAAQPSSEAPGKASSAGAPRKQKAAAKKPASATGKPSKKSADVALNAPDPSISPDAAATAQDAPEPKPSKRRGKISLFKNAVSEPANSAKDADRQTASAQSEAGPVDSAQPPSSTASKPRGSKRMAREPKSGAA